jgi:hypothetical protein
MRRHERTAARAYARDGETERSRQFWTLDVVAPGCVGQGEPRGFSSKTRAVWDVVQESRSRRDRGWKELDSDLANGGMTDGTQVGLSGGARLQDSPFPGGAVQPYLMLW